MAGTESTDDTLKRKSEDIGWEYGELADPGMKKIKCKLCNMVFTGGVFRLKQHIARVKGNVAPCGKSTPVDQAKCKQALDAVKKRKDSKREMATEVRAEVSMTLNLNLALEAIACHRPELFLRRY